MRSKQGFAIQWLKTSVTQQQMDPFYESGNTKPAEEGNGGWGGGAEEGKGGGLRFHRLWPRYSRPLTPTGSTVVRLSETLPY